MRVRIKIVEIPIVENVVDVVFVYQFSDIPRKVDECAQVGIQLAIELLRSGMPGRLGHLAMQLLIRLENSN